MEITPDDSIEYLLADLGAINTMLASMHEEDLVGRMGFESRKRNIEAELIKRGVHLKDESKNGN